MPEGHYTNIRCRTCGCHYVDSDVSEAYLDDVMATLTQEIENKTIYEATREQETIRHAELSENWAMIKRVRPPRTGDRLLDYGSAWGAFGSIAKQDGVVPNGIELQHPGAERSRELWGGASTVHEGPIETAPYPDESFSYVTSFETLEHVFDPIRILTHMGRLEMTDGVVGISVPSAHYFAFKFWLYRQSPISGFMLRRFPGSMSATSRVLIHNHIITPSPTSVRLMMEKAGLRVVHTEPFCSGLSGGTVGRVLRLVGRMVWYLSFKQIYFAPSIFAVAVRSDG